MDIEQLRTLLEINRVRHFRVAAESLFVTQSAVSARIKKLEEELGVTLFERNRRDVRLTPEGNRMLHHAEAMLAIWRRAQQDVALADEASAQLAVGGIYNLWEVLLQDWIYDLHEQIPQLALVAEAYSHEHLLRRLLDGVLDIIFTFEPPQLEDLQTVEVASTPLIMVSSTADSDIEDAFANAYVMVDWGQSFLLQHAREYPAASAPSHRMNQARIALQFILQRGGSAYLAEQMVAEQIEQGELHRVMQAAVFKRTIYATYSWRSARVELIEQVLQHF